jgi:hypothetical protein
VLVVLVDCSNEIALISISHVSNLLIVLLAIVNFGCTILLSSGYVMGLKQVYPDLENAYVLILGAGGASKGIANELSKIVQPK